MKIHIKGVWGNENWAILRTEIFKTIFLKKSKDMSKRMLY